MSDRRAGPGPDLQRRANRSAVLQILADTVPRPVSELRSGTGLSRQTLESILTDLQREGWVASADTAAVAGAGRPARRYTLAPDAGFVAGVDVGVNKVLVLVADLTGTPRSRVRRDVSASSGGRARAEALRSAVTEAVGALGLETPELLGIGIGVPGIVDRDGALSRSVVVPEWAGPAFGAELADWAGCPVDLVNDANLALVGEHWAGRARGHQDVVFVLAGLRTRAAVMIDGQLHAGRHGAAGEFGSVPGLDVDAAALLLGPGHGRHTDVAGVFGRARRGGPVARSRIADYCVALARAVSTLALVLDPGLVVIGGGLSRAGTALLDAVVSQLATDVLTPVELSVLGEEAVAYGAVRHALLAAGRTRPALAAITGSTPVPGTGLPTGSHPAADLVPGVTR